MRQATDFDDLIGLLFDGGIIKVEGELKHGIPVVYAAVFRQPDAVECGYLVVKLPKGGDLEGTVALAREDMEAGVKVWMLRAEECPEGVQFDME